MTSVPVALFVSLILKSVLVVAASFAAIGLMRRRSAAARHAILAAAFGALLLLPLAVWLTPPLPLAVLPSDAVQMPPSVMSELPPASELPRLATKPAASAPSTLAVHLTIIDGLELVWLAGALIALFPLLAGLADARRLRRTSSTFARLNESAAELARTAGIQRRVEMLVHPESIGPLTFGPIRPVVLLPSEAERWARADFERALIHELEHVRRADCLTQAIARAVCALYWFNPLVWMAWRRLALEAERACDDAVLHVADPVAYADQLVALARTMVHARRVAYLALAARSDLGRRVRSVLDANQPRARAHARTVVAAVLAAIALAFAIAPATLARAQSGIAQAAFPPASSLPAFTTVSVKPFKPTGPWHRPARVDPQRLTIEGMYVGELIEWAYQIDWDQIAGLPTWTNAKAFAVTGVTDKPATEAQMRLMLRRVLAERFHFAFTVADTPQPVYALKIAPGGLKLKPVASASDCGQHVINSNSPMFKAAKIPSDAMVGSEVCTVASLLKTLNLRAGESHTLPIVDRTGLTGQYGIVLWQRMTSHPVGPGRFKIDYEEPLNDALKQEMGLELVKTTAPWLVLHVTRFEPPTPN